MSRDEMVRKYNHYVGMRESYKSKLTANTDARNKVISYFENCISYRESMEVYNGESKFFSDLYGRNLARYSQIRLDEIDGMFESVAQHINLKITEAQGEINYWNSEISRYDEKRKEEA
ncbi:MAG: hypothetical protein NC393_01325 [Clostridium sp.]|nr:hypothetical protein [Clostridium sp.]MCM1170744.1 hypothetical protein [Clostridium sp.]MCM1207617.1 hypothetical protein [Ruminococcus sp.]